MESAKQTTSNKEKGQGLVEYALLLVLVAIIVIGVLGLLGNRIKLVYGTVTCALDLGSDIIGAGVNSVGGNMVVDVRARRNTTITISGDVSGGGACTAPSCSFTLGGVPAKGSLKITASSGRCEIIHSW